MRVAIAALALVSCAAWAQDRPPNGTYYDLDKAPTRPAWPDPKTLTPYERYQMEVLLRLSPSFASERAIDEYRRLTPEQKAAHSEELRRALRGEGTDQTTGR